jgi:NDP-sugar pyrophosphorylase family protein
MRAVILAGGRGTRLAPYTTVLPKPLVPVGERPILELILHQLSRAGFDRVDLCVGHLGELIRAYLADSGTVPAGMKLNYHVEDTPLGTAGAIRNLEEPTGSLLVMNGDILTTLPYADLIAFHEQQGATLTIASHRAEVNVDLGVIEGDDAVVTGYVEKPALEYEVSMGVYAYSPTAVAHIPEGRFDLPDLVLALIAAGERVCKFGFTGPWYDIGTAGELSNASAAFSERPGIFDPGYRFDRDPDG